MIVARYPRRKDLRRAYLAWVLGNANESAEITEVISRFGWHAPGPEEGQPLRAMSFRVSAISVIDDDIYIAFR